MSDTRQRCLYCGRDNVPGAECVPCRILVPPAAGANMRPGPCARCPSPFLEATSLGHNDAVAFECKGCHSAFLTAYSWTALFDTVLAGDALDLSHFQDRAPASVNIFPLVRCSVCRYEMERARFGVSTQLVIDVCNAHGVWLDPSELPRLVEIISGQETGMREETEAVEAPDAVETYLLNELRAAEQAYDLNVGNGPHMYSEDDPRRHDMMLYLGRINAIRVQLDGRRLEKFGEREARRRLKNGY